MQVLIQARVEVQDRYGLRLIIEGLDPAYTVGIMAQQLEIIRQTLERIGVADYLSYLIGFIRWRSS